MDAGNERDKLNFFNVKPLLMSYMGGRIRKIIAPVEDWFFRNINEVRLRADKPLIVRKGNEDWFIDEGSFGAERHTDKPFCPDARDISETVEMLCNYSLYAFEDELKNGFLTIPGGCRVGICGRAVIEGGKIKTVKNIGSLNFRIMREVRGCADGIMGLIAKPQPMHTLIISPPCKGKTTLLRDIIRQVSDGFDGTGGCTVGIADERGEIAACYAGVPQNDVGLRTDVLDLCPKAEGMALLLRSMSPQIIAADEIGRKEDIYAIEELLNAGVKIFCTVHGSGINDVSNKPVLNELIKRKVFERYIVIKGTGKPGVIEGVYGGDFERLK